jgi:hypothetical protein
MHGSPLDFGVVIDLALCSILCLCVLLGAIASMPDEPPSHEDSYHNKYDDKSADSKKPPTSEPSYWVAGGCAALFLLVFLACAAEWQHDPEAPHREQTAAFIPALNSRN